MKKPRPVWRISIAVLTVLAIGALTVAVGRAWALIPTAEVNLADVVTVVFAGATAICAVAIWARRRAVPSTTDLPAAAGVLAGLVERQWRLEARHRLLDDPQPIPVHWRLTTDATVMSLPSLITDDGEPALTGRGDDMACLGAAFRALKRRRLVITGGAGMGKTTLAVQLLLQLLASRAADKERAGEVVPVPVLFPVSGWDTDAHPRVHDWIAVRLVQDYPALAAADLGPDAAAALAEGGHILLILDGLDEIPEAARARVIEALNASLTARDQLILTSRTAEFAAAVHAAGRPLNAAAVITPTLLTPQAAAGYLATCFPAAPSAAWQDVLTALRGHALPGLTELAATPMGVWLIRTVYIAPGADPAPLTGPLGHDPDRLRAHLLDGLIGTVIATRPPTTDPAEPFRPRRAWHPDRARDHLAFLARVLHAHGTRDLAWWMLAQQAQTPAERWRTALRTGFAGGFAFALLSALAAGLALTLPPFQDPFTEWPTSLLFGGLAGWLVATCTAGMAAGLAARRFVLRALTSRIGADLVFGLVFGLIAGTGFGVAFAFAVTPVSSADSYLLISMSGLAGWLGIMAGIAMRRWATFSGQTARLTVRIGTDLAFGLVLGCVIAVAIQLGPALPPEASLASRLGIMVVAGLVARVSLARILTFALAIGISDPLVAALAGSLPRSWAIWNVAEYLVVWAGLSGWFGLAAGLVIMLATRQWFTQAPGYADLNVRGRVAGLIRDLGGNLGSGLLAGLVIGPVAGLGTAYVSPLMTDILVNDLVEHLAFGLRFGLVFGPAVLLVSGLVTWAEQPASGTTAATPLSSWRADRRLTLLRVLSTTVAVALAGWLAFGVEFAFASIILGPVAGLLVGLTAGDHHAWLAGKITIRHLKRAGKVPADLITFLDDAHRLGLLRTVGPVYQFRHAALHDHLVRSDTTELIGVNRGSSAGR
ncbi:NACHT domain-containing protein [Streptosporangium canum]|uniref:NACHT domain-containing protein n=1 Tax=Streptosporangium canum TaxID=324952 RepID=UPI00341721DB